MRKVYQGKTVTVVRDARSGDSGFDNTNPSDQLLIKLEDGSQRVVKRTEVTDQA